jgi:hypothetical protein
VSLPALPIPKPSAQVQPFYEVRGPALTVTFLLQFGGAELRLSADPKGRGAVERLAGAAMLHWQGHSRADIARTLGVSDVTVRRWLNGEARA